ncbi:hypothetical protein SAMN02745857_03897 [Andreprevotia lacus DSM 23236]|jgi:hypothetical protein|uniref:L27 domain-containing protein n=1 Tax=Andreprevotia lacus DSM 23236 TaxID=1121001 RepID=A0A1W1XZY7_9NEIS|nr:hypothetical protein [Andreprevotia lacus]SMC29530.1 hypothetical protein SAMN02745857_03897 [Andreprevotia lacus DSM 23236]
MSALLSIHDVMRVTVNQPESHGVGSLQVVTQRIELFTASGETVAFDAVFCRKAEAAALQGPKQ